MIIDSLNGSHLRRQTHYKPPKGKWEITAKATRVHKVDYIYRTTKIEGGEKDN